MRTPSTSDLVHAEANKAYDKLAVISDNIEALREIYDVIFDLQEWLRQKLKDYISIDVDQSIDSVKSFNKEPRLIGAKYYSNLDALENIGRTYATYIDGNPALCFEVTRTEPSSNSNLTNDIVYTDKAYLIFNEDTKKFHLDIPPTIGTDDYSSVRVDYLNQRLSELQLVSSQEIQAAIDAIEFDDTPTDGSSNPVRSNGIYHFIMNLLPTYGPVADEAENPCTGHTIYWAIQDAIAGLSPSGSAYTLPIASDERLGGIKVGDYLTINANGVLSVDIDAIKYSLGLTSFNDENIGYVSASFDQLFSGAPSGSDTTAWSSSNTSLLGDCIGAGNSFLEPQILISVANNGEYNRFKNFGTTGNSIIKHAVNIATRFYCTNKTTQVVKSYVPLRTVIIYNGIRHPNGGTEMVGIYWQNVEIRAWYKAYNYSLTAEDISAVNADANAFAASLQLGYDTGEFGDIE
jgi:hypothetical protein